MRVEDVAKLILDKRISGVPVVDVYQNVIRIVSEGELIRRFEETGRGNPTFPGGFNLLPAQRSERRVM